MPDGERCVRTPKNRDLDLYDDESMQARRRERRRRREQVFFFFFLCVDM
jgi:hypothetical protein